MSSVFSTYFAPDERPLAGAVAGLAGGLAAAFAMDLFQKFVPAKRFARLLGDPAPDPRAEPATEKAAQAVSTNVFHHHLAKTEKQAAAPVVHYATGGGIGLVYGLAAEYLPATTTALGLPFGTAVWALADEAAVPALGFSKPPQKIPASTHLYALASHLVYGLVTEGVRRGVRAALD